ncbi:MULTISPECIES: amidohydrolase family protein [unclassified Haladaptatus]|uniref:metal-dependent hydrolase family protein n=1 Tax=unclassified Haladaptatus TaxID=2622732 RepID=UPI00209C1B44|nr:MULTISPECIES: amidohydrolase family protein [unclassified Haladaptatus]MCO8244281.1 amidohydrolase family protein [Haladaptatus sp. AB643]MCO8254095.1 amidohydrolase family protein [Haladaptatus sp. AB618]
MLVLRGADVVDANGIREADVAIEDGEIVSVGDVSDADEELDVSGKFVAPGLIDAHIHSSMDGRPDVTSVFGDSDMMLSYRAVSNLRDALRAGVTTVRDLGSPTTLALDAADAIDAGLIEGPRIVACGQNVVMTGGHGHWHGREADGEAEVKKAVREQLKRGADVVKCMATGGVLTDGAITGSPELDEAELTTLVETAAAKHVPTAAHAHGTEGIKNAVRAGISSIEHGTFMDREAAKMMAERGTYWVPTAKASAGIVEHGTEAGIPEYAVEKAEDAIDSVADAFEYAMDAEVPIAMGTDAGTPFNFHADIPEELELMVEYGMSPEAALEAATVNAADLLGLSDVGLVEEGYRADLVILDSDPREDERTWQSPAKIMSNGSIVR